MSGRSEGWEISVSVNEDAGPLGCSILLDLIDTRIYGSWEYEPSGETGILEVAPELLRGMVEGVAGAGFQLLVQVPKDSGIPGSWPCAAADGTKAASCLDRVLARRAQPATYPFSVWSFPARRSAEILRAISDFAADRMNPGHFTRVIELGGGRISVFRSSITYNFPPAELEAARSLVLAASRKSSVEFVWEDRP